ncbi:MAG: hypothetical protein EXX96DRAFT_586103 [Benjaminiella poitrasii]|nr:MAG: hypothetical protein EXX96DRAFT_586103 [Benjaminiella poitrasii]
MNDFLFCFISYSFCNATSVAWNCECSKKNADFATYLWPVVQAECTGKAQDCQMICNRDTMKPAACSTACTAYYQCDNVNAPPSYLQTENPSDVPSYNGPKKVVTNTTNVSNNDTTSNHTDSSDTPSSDASAINYSNRNAMAYVFISMTLLAAGSTTFF